MLLTYSERSPGRLLAGPRYALVLLRPLPEYNDYFGYAIAGAYLEASGETVTTAYDPWRDLITEIRPFRVDVHDVADRLRSMQSPPPTG